jgi:hypothetical protein
MEPGKTLLARALRQIEMHEAWRTLVVTPRRAQLLLRA